MKCKFCDFEQTETFKTCPNCNKQQLSVFSDKTDAKVSVQHHSSDIIKGILIGLFVSAISNGLIAGLTYGISIVIIGLFGLYNTIGFIIILSTFVISSVILGFVYNKLYKSLGLENDSLFAANTSYIVVAVVILSSFF